jgi:putative heme iron utilization protein
MSFMRTVVENAISTMSPQERQEALQTVTAQVVSSMSEQERVDALAQIVRQLVDTIPAERLHEVFRSSSAS